MIRLWSYIELGFNPSSFTYYVSVDKVLTPSVHQVPYLKIGVL